MSAARAPDGTLDRYLYGPRGNLYAILRGADRFYVATDQVGSPRVVVAADGTVVKRLEYDAYGVTTDHDPGFFLPVRLRRRPARPGYWARALRPARLRAAVRALHRARPRDVRRLAALALRLREQLARLLPRPRRHRVAQLGGYLGGGGGVTLYFDPSAFFDPEKPLITGLCVEAGLGLGGGVEGDVLEQAPTDGGGPDRDRRAQREKSRSSAAKIGGEFDLICGPARASWARTSARCSSGATAATRAAPPSAAP